MLKRFWEYWGEIIFVVATVFAAYELFVMAFRIVAGR